MGDFNCCNILTKHALSFKINDLCSSLSLKQLISEPTSVTEKSSTLIDLILSNSSSIFKFGVIHLGISDHNLTYVVQKFKRLKGEGQIEKNTNYF